eukprot:TRINITY_DN77829_c0_g1_i1.p1 TRINITY_DN77829_c0_g1~~TRINITY_DN77829_c0_g1_i1.p1  ORF type:complete len:268 (+),score=13.76 TRINITY_DN77829_c0_g1_i1:19-822(+)
MCKTTFLFAVPIYRRNILSVIGREYNNVLSSHALAAFASFSEHKKEPTEMINHLFFRHQLSQGLLKFGSGLQQLQNEPAFNALRDEMRATAQQYLNQHCVSNPQDISEKFLYSWASVQPASCGHFHAPHVHSDSMVCGVYYSKMPEGSSDLVFHDPRGTSPLNPEAESTLPFHTTYTVEGLQEGDLVLFPPWLVHSVPASDLHAGENRIAFPFNVVGDWFALNSVLHDAEIDESLHVKVTHTENILTPPPQKEAPSKSLFGRWWGKN